MRNRLPALGGDGASAGAARFDMTFNPGARSDREVTILGIVRTLGETEAMHRLLLCGRYQALWDALEADRGA